MLETTSPSALRFINPVVQGDGTKISQAPQLSDQAFKGQSFPAQDEAAPLNSRVKAKNGSQKQEGKEEKPKQKAEEASKGFFRWMADNITGGIQYVAAFGVDAFLNMNAASFHEKALQSIKESKLITLNNSDSSFLNLTEVLTDFICNSVLSNPEKDDEAELNESSFINNHRNIIKDIIEANLAKGFANLSEAVHENYDPNQSYLNNVFSLICERAGQHVSMEALEEIANRYKDNLTIVKRTTHELLSHCNPEFKAELEKLIQEFPEASEARKKAIINSLKANAKEVDNETWDQLTNNLNALSSHHKELHNLFSNMANEILIILFPNKVQDITLPGESLIHLPWLPNYIYDNYLHSFLVDKLLEFYKPLENNINSNTQYITLIQQKIGNHDLNEITHTAINLLVGYGKYVLKTDSTVIDLIAKFLASISSDYPEGFEDKNLDEAAKKEILLAQLSQEQLATWITESLQAMLDTNNPHLLGFSKFIQQIMANLSLALLGKGTQLVFPENETIAEDQFLKELADRLVNQLRSQENDWFTLENLAEWAKDLPLPKMLIDKLLPTVIETVNNTFRDPIVKALPTEMQEDSPPRNTEEIISNYKNGQNLLSIINTISDELVEEILEKNIGMISEYHLEEQLNQFLQDYLPGVQINTELRTWLEKNFNSLRANEEGHSPQSIKFLKEGIRAVLRERVIQTIEHTFGNNHEAYIAQILNNLHLAFAKAFANYDDITREQILEGQQLLLEIHERNTEIERLKAAASIDMEGLNPDQKQVLEQVKIATLALQRARSRSNNLVNNLTQILQKLGNAPNDKEWLDQLNYVQDAFKLYKIQISSLFIPEVQFEFLLQLNNDIANLEQTAPNDPEAKENLERHKMLRTLVNMNSDQLKLIIEALNINSVLDNALKEERQYEEKLSQAQEALEILERSLEANEAWNAAKAQQIAFLERNETITQLTEKITKLERGLDPYLPAFKVLSQELMSLLGLGQKDNLNLPAFLQDQIWPHIETARDTSIARLLFSQLTPLILVIFDIEENREALKALTQGDEFLIQIAQVVANQGINQIPDFITSYKPFAKQILEIMQEKKKEPTAEEIDRMEIVLQQTLIELGTEGLTPSMLESNLVGIFHKKAPANINENEQQELKRLEKEQEQACSLHLQQIAQEVGFKEFKQEQVVEILTRFLPHETIKQRKSIEKKALILARNLNQTLLNRGKPKLNASTIAQIYYSQNQELYLFSEEETAQKIKDLKKAHIVRKIRSVVITPEEIAHTLNDFIPGAYDLHNLIGPQLQMVIAGEDETFKEHRGLVGKYVEGMLLRAFIKIAEANQVSGLSVLEVITSKLAAMIQANEEGLSTEEISHRMINQLIENMGGLTSEKDFKGVPLPLQKVVYEKVKEIFHTHLAPRLVVLIEREQTQAYLDAISGSTRLKELSGELSKFVLNAGPSYVNSYEDIAHQIIGLLESGPIEQDPLELIDLIPEPVPGNRAIDEQQVRQLAKELENLAQAANLSTQIAKIIDDPKLVDKVIDLIKHSDLNDQLLDELTTLVENRELANRITQLVNDVAAAKITTTKLVQAYAQANNLNLSIETMNRFKEVLKKNSIKEHFTQIVITPEQIGESLKTSLLPNMGDEFQQLLVREIRNLLNTQTLTFNNIAGFASAYLDSILLKVFSKIAEKNPPQEGKDSFFVAIDKMLAIASAKYSAAKERPIETVAEELEDEILRDVLGITSPASLEGIPEGLQEKIYDLIKNQISNTVLRVYEQGKRLKSDNSQIMQARADLGRFGAAKNAAKSYAETLADDIGQMAIASIFDYLKETSLDTHEILNSITKSIESSLAPLAATNAQLVNTLLEYVHDDQFGRLITNTFTNLANSDNLAEDKIKAAELVSNLIVIPLNQFLEKALTFEESLGDQAVNFDRNLVTSLLGGVVNHLRTLNAAKERAINNGRTKISYTDFIAVAPENSILPTPTYEKTIATIFNRLPPLEVLNDEQRILIESKKTELKDILANFVAQEDQGIENIDLDKLVEAIAGFYFEKTGLHLTENDKIALSAKNEKGLTLKEILRKEAVRMTAKMEKELYKPLANQILKLVFPNEEKDLFFIAPEMRGASWKLVEGLMPTAIPKIIESLFDPAMIEKLALSSLQAARDNLDKKIVLSDDPGEPADRELDALDNISGELMVELFKNVELPGFIKNQIIDPVNGVSPSMKKAIGASLRDQFKGTFIKELIPTILESAVKRDPKTGEFPLEAKPFVAKTKAEKAAETAQKRAEMQTELKKVARQLVGSSISNYIRKQWATFQRSFDKLVASIFGNIGAKTKKVLDKIFHFIFLTIIGKTLAVLLYPVKRLLKELIYRVASLDKNLDNVLSLFTHMPEDQPLKKKHAIYHENLVNELREGITRVFEEAVPA